MQFQTSKKVTVILQLYKTCLTESSFFAVSFQGF